MLRYFLYANTTFGQLSESIVIILSRRISLQQNQWFLISLGCTQNIKAFEIQQ